MMHIVLFISSFKIEKDFFYLTIFWSRNNSWQRNASIFEFQLAVIFASSVIIRFEPRPILAICDGLTRFLTFFPRWLEVMKSTDQNVSASKSKIVDSACTLSLRNCNDRNKNENQNFHIVSLNFESPC